jgi:hypothetical protein
MDASAGVKMIFPVKRKPTVSREEFIASWFAHHMPVTIEAMGDRGWGYIGTVFEPAEEPGERWDGIAQMFLDVPLPNPSLGFGANPVDSFHERAVQPYFGWSTHEFVVTAGSDELPVEPLTLNDPFPTSRSGFFKVVTFVPLQPAADNAALQAHWLEERAPWVSRALQQAGGFRYVVSLGTDVQAGAYLGMEELYFPGKTAWLRFQEITSQDDIVGRTASLYYAGTEFVAIPV